MIPGGGTISGAVVGNSTEVGSNSNNCIYGGEFLSVPGYENNIYVLVDQSITTQEGTGFRISAANLNLNFWEVNKDSSGNLQYESLKDLNFIQSIPSSPYAHLVQICVGDFDGDGYKNELALLFNGAIRIDFYVYRLIYSDEKLQLKSLGSSSGNNIYNSKSYIFNIPVFVQAASQIIAGDFDGDGVDEIGIIYREAEMDEGRNCGKINCAIYKWNSQKASYDSETTQIDCSYYEYANWSGYKKWSGIAGLKAVAADLDGDGKDEIVTLLVGYYEFRQTTSQVKKYEGTIYRHQWLLEYQPYLTRWYCEKSSIKPIFDSNNIKGNGVQEGLLKTSGSSLIGSALVRYSKNETSANSKGTPPWDRFNDKYINYYWIPETFSLVAGQFTGTMGTAKTVDDIALSWVDASQRIYLFKTNLQNNSFNGFGDYIKVFDSSALDDSVKNKYTSAGLFRGALVAADFAGEGVELAEPVHFVKKGDRSYVSVLNAPPYHVDNISDDFVSLQDDPKNFTYSNGGDGSMKVFYDYASASDESKEIKFTLNSSYETIFAIDSKNTRAALDPAKNALKFIGVAANAFDKTKMVGTIAEGANTFLSSLIDKVENTTNTTNKNTTSSIFEDNIQAMTNDTVLFYVANQHVWRYRILANPVPSWLKTGGRIDSVQSDSTGDDTEHYITFTLYDDIRKGMSDSVGDNLYQPFHEEGNLFSYPQSVEDIEGYNAAGLLTKATDWTYNNELYSTSAAFTEAKNEMSQTEVSVSESWLTKTVSIVDSLQGSTDVGIKSIVPSVGDPENFTKSYSKTEKIGFELRGRSDLGLNAVNTLEFIAYVGKEGAMSLGAAVKELNRDSKLWQNTSIYNLYPDPALLLPLKFLKNGDNFRANDDNHTAMNLRGMRFYAPDYAVYTDNRLVAGEKYKIRVPLYNASFKDTGNFNVKLSYTLEKDATADKNLISNVTASIGGWKNGSDNNKKWVEFDWTPDIETGEYYFYVEIDPDNNLKEVHESRLKSDNKTVQDYGGNNTGFYKFYVFDPSDNLYKDYVNNNNNTLKASSLKTAADDDDDEWLTDLDLPGGKVKIKFNGSNNLFDFMVDLVIWSNDYGYDSPMPVKCEIEYSGEYIFPYARFAGFTLKDGVSARIGENYDLITDEDIDSYFVIHDTTLIPDDVAELSFFISAKMIEESDETLYGLIVPYSDILDNVDTTGENIESASAGNYDASKYVNVNSTTEYNFTSDQEAYWEVLSIDLISSEVAGAADYSEDSDSIKNTFNISWSPEDVSTGRSATDSATLSLSQIAGVTLKGDYKISVISYGEDGEVLGIKTVEYETVNSSEGAAILGGSSGGCNFNFNSGIMNLILIFGIGILLKFRKK